MAQVIFNPGDVVKLVSGGPAMSVSRPANGLVVCVWYDEQAKKFDHITLSPSVLIKTTAPIPSGLVSQSQFGNQSK
ncbi:DUF2158 domain-containing protein [Mucilaginibacter sp. Bleaf8]|uniref:YodC family protein n=1 Tax=Mucilaginibacter sp. Bleaf8 TaxID=2834430 RepID=UPI001BCF2F6E|nr:DUF2158 domain-containing protein [Mucilaginibacter sp. Bleaf8]MBS7564759.1 DUF2158 domain-containing protein [Mucilaginibacter sp. Bleaf8]